MKIDTSIFEELLQKGLIVGRLHPQGKLIVYNYTAKAQYQKQWTKEIMQCRGLICDLNGKIVARPFEKFFNIEEYNYPLPDEEFEIYEKLDGSLGILYFFEGVPCIASRGSFDSPQAIKASSMLHEQYKSSVPKLNKEKTYLFEIIYPGNKFVVDYKKESSLTLLAVIDTKTGIEENLEQYKDIGFPIITKFKPNKLEELKKLNLPDKEGFVVKFINGLRLKIKFENYLERHAVISKISNVSIWQMLYENKSFEQILENAPDELYAWITEQRNAFLNEYKNIESVALRDYKSIVESNDLNDRKKIARLISNTNYPKLVFAKLDNKNYHEKIWKILEPQEELPFRLRKNLTSTSS